MMNKIQYEQFQSFYQSGTEKPWLPFEAGVSDPFASEAAWDGFLESTPPYLN
jgi:hypothetical protein